MDVGRRGIEADLHRQRPAGDLAEEIRLLDDIHGAAAEDLDLGGRGSHGGRGL
jgi:hypothetical protein